MVWILATAAVGDLDRIAAEGARQFGFVQSEIYERKLVDMLETLASNLAWQPSAKPRMERSG